MMKNQNFRIIWRKMLGPKVLMDMENMSLFFIYNCNFLLFYLNNYVCLLACAQKVFL